MKIVEVFSLGKAIYNPDPRHFHDKDKSRGWWGYDERHHRHYWRWDNKHHRWY